MFSEKIHRYIYVFGWLALAFGMMMGTVPTSVPQLILAGNWLLEGDFRRKWNELRGNRLFWLLALLYLIHVAGVFYSADLPAAAQDIRTKLPLLFLPLVMLSSRPLGEAELRRVLYFFVAGCVVNTLWCFTYSFVLHHNEVVRNASRFMSHIRLGLYLNMAIAVCLYYGPRERRKAVRALLLLLPAYFVISMLLLGLASGLANFLLLGTCAALVVVFRSRMWLRVAAVVFLATTTVLVTWYLRDVAAEQLRVKDHPSNKKQSHSMAGELMFHADTAGQKENGFYVLINVQQMELENGWNHDFPDDSIVLGRNKNAQRCEVLVRYMASKGLVKDSAGYAQLTPGDKENIRKNYTNYLQPGWSFLHKRSYELVNEYDEFINRRSVNGHSFTMRLYFWKATLSAIGASPVFGYGTGDVQQTLDDWYRSTESPLSQEWRLRPHNQFLTVTLALGCAGLLLLLVSLVIPPLFLRRHLLLIYWPFAALVFISFLFEDTLETQAGLTFFAFFNVLLLGDAWFRKKGTPEDSQAPR